MGRIKETIEHCLAVEASASERHRGSPGDLPGNQRCVADRAYSSASCKPMLRSQDAPQIPLLNNINQGLGQRLPPLLAELHPMPLALRIAKKP
jgi:hypothetical protein